MKHLFTLLILCFLLSINLSVAQKDNGPIYAAKVRANSPAANKRRNDEITYQAKITFSSLSELLNELTSASLNDSERNSVLQNSYLPNQNQIFFNDGVVIEDDIDPKHTSSENTAELLVERYLRNLDLYYSKSDTATIRFTQVITSPVQDGKDYPYIKIFFTSTFGGQQTETKATYQPVSRVAELRAETINGKWRTFVTRLGFLRPGEGLTELTSPTIKMEEDRRTKPSVGGPELVYKSDGSSSDSLTIKKDQRWLQVIRASTGQVPAGFYQRSTLNNLSQDNVSIMLINKDKQLAFRRIDGTSLIFNKTTKFPFDPSKEKRKLKRWGWVQLVTGVIALGASYTGYASLHNSYNDYTSRLATVNAEYSVWASLSQQPGSAPSAPMAFNEYARPGIYGVYGGAAVGGTLLLNGIRCLLKAGRIKIPANK